MSTSATSDPPTPESPREPAETLATSGDAGSCAAAPAANSPDQSVGHVPFGSDPGGGDAGLFPDADQAPVRSAGRAAARRRQRLDRLLHGLPERRPDWHVSLPGDSPLESLRRHGRAAVGKSPERLLVSAELDFLRLQRGLRAGLDDGRPSVVGRVRGVPAVPATGFLAAERLGGRRPVDRRTVQRRPSGRRALWPDLHGCLDSLGLAGLRAFSARPGRRSAARVPGVGAQRPGGACAGGLLLGRRADLVRRDRRRAPAAEPGLVRGRSVLRTLVLCGTADGGAGRRRFCSLPDLRQTVPAECWIPSRQQLTSWARIWPISGSCCDADALGGPEAHQGPGGFYCETLCHFGLVGLFLAAIGVGFSWRRYPVRRYACVWLVAFGFALGARRTGLLAISGTGSGRDALSRTESSVVSVRRRDHGVGGCRTGSHPADVRETTSVRAGGTWCGLWQSGG